jgi:hypothetical protein
MPDRNFESICELFDLVAPLHDRDCWTVATSKRNVTGKLRGYTKRSDSENANESTYATTRFGP